MFVADTAINAISKHMWYLTEELVPLCLFSNTLTNAAKQKVVDKLLTIENSEENFSRKRIGTGYGKPCFPEVPSIPTYELVDYVGADSWSFFHIPKLETGFLSSKVVNWPTNNDYILAKKLFRIYVL